MDDDNEQGNEINLGEQDENDGMPETAMGKPSPEPQYPTVMLHGGPELQRISDNGTHRVKARVVSRHFPSKHSKHHKVELELHSIRPQNKRGRPNKSKHEEDSERIKQEMENVQD